MYVPKISFRLRASTFRSVCDAVIPHLTEDEVMLLKKINVFHFMSIPRTSQCMPVILTILSRWSIEEQAFLIGDHVLRFTIDEVALMIGLPNHGEEVIWTKEPLAKITSINIKNQMKNYKSYDNTDIVGLYIKFLLTNLFFPYSNYKVPKGLLSYSNNIHKFPYYNWPLAIWKFLIIQLDGITMKIRAEQPLGYISGFVSLILIWFLEHSNIVNPNMKQLRPRIMRWPENFWWSMDEAKTIVSNLCRDQVYDSFIDIFKDEVHLLAYGLNTEDLESDSAHFLTEPHHPPSPPKKSFHSPTPSPPNNSEYKTNKDLFLLLKNLDDRLSNFETKFFDKVMDYDKRVRYLENHLFSSKTDKIENKKNDISTNEVYDVGEISKMEVENKEQGKQPRIVDAETLVPVTSTALQVSEPMTPRRALKQGNVALGVKQKNKRKRKGFVFSFIRGESKKRNVVLDKEGISIEDIPSKDILIDSINQIVIGSSPMKIPEDSIIHIRPTPIKPRPAAVFINYPGRELVSDHIRDYIDIGLRQFNDLDDIIFETGNIVICRRHIDDLLSDRYLSDLHIDAFTFLIEEKGKLCPDLYKSFLYISSSHWSYSKYKTMEAESKLYVAHVNRETVREAKYIILPIVHNNHWRLLIAYIKEKIWFFFDSLPNPTHKAILPEPIKVFTEDTKDAFSDDLKKWPIVTVSGLPTQTNSFDCGMFVCKYIEIVVCSDIVDWKMHKDWQEKMPIFRAEFAYSLFSRSIIHS